MKICVWKLWSFKRQKQCRHRQWLQLKHRLHMHGSHAWIVDGHMHISGKFHMEVEATISLFIFFALVSEEPSSQCMCNVCTIQQHISSSEMEPGLNLWPVTRPDPDALWPGDPTRWLSICELRYYFDNGVLQVNAFCQKSLIYAAHTQSMKISNIIVSLFSTEK